MVSFASFIIVIAGLKIASSIIIPFLLALFFAIICLPLFHFLIRKRIPPWLSLIVIFILIILIIGVIGVLIGSSFQGFSENLPAYQAKLERVVNASFSQLKVWGISLPEKRLLKISDPGTIMRYVSASLKSFGNVMSNGFLILLLVIFLLVEAATFSKKLSFIVKNSETTAYFETFFRNVTRYVALKTIISLLTGVFVSIMLLVLGVDFALLWGVAAFLLNYIPNIGSLIAAIPPILLALVQFGVGKTLIVAAGYLVVNIVVGSIIEPRVMGRGLGLSTLIVFISLVFWGWVFGPVGMFLSVPLTMVVKIALDSQEETRWIAVMLSNAAPDDNP